MLQNTLTAGKAYTAKVTASDGKADTEAPVVTINTGTGINDWYSAKFRVYPNPVSDVLTIEWDNSGKTSFSVLDLAGRELFNSSPDL